MLLQDLLCSTPNNPFKICVCGDGYDVSSVLSINMKLNALCGPFLQLSHNERLEIVTLHNVMESNIFKFVG